MPVCTNTPSRFLGCDVGRAEIVVFDSCDGTTRSIANRPDALAAFAAGLEPDGLVICEATGGYEDALLAALATAGRPAHRADARKVKAFIRSFGTLGKSDALDARALARYGAERHASLTRWSASDPARERLQVLVRTRGELVAQRVACTNRLKAPGVAPVETMLKALLICLAEQIAAIEDAIDQIRRDVPAIAKAAKALRSIAGIGPATAAALIALMPELGSIGRRQAAALAGLAPHPNQSGASDAYRRTRGGRTEIKRILFLPALAAARHDPAMSSAYQALIKRQKKPIVAIVAIMRRIIVVANARLRDAKY
ncbi:IS110 family transposase [Bosea sp. MMO-172]|uniref:IS110 family transposase n=1 Tax=Bosea sp. MMO-172 TaxID=3127885 RepID=UPI00301B45C6